MLKQIWRNLRNQYAGRRAQERDQAFELAARHCDALANLFTDPRSAFDTGYAMAARRAAKDIRAMKGSQ